MWAFSTARVALVTGAGQGVGRGIALAMAREGAVIVVVDRNSETAAETVALIADAGGDALHRICNVENSDEVNACVASVVEATGTVDILVNNAVDAVVGIPLQDLDDEQFLISFASGPFASFWFMRACFPYSRMEGVSSTCGRERRINRWRGTAPMFPPRPQLAD